MMNSNMISQKHTPHKHFSLKNHLQQTGVFLCVIVALWMSTFTRVDASSSIHYLMQDEIAYLNSPLDSSRFLCIGSVPYIVDTNRAFVKGQYPGITTLTYQKDGKVMQKDVCVKGILPARPLLETGQKQQLHLFGVKQDLIATWISSDSSVVSVDQNGCLLAESNGSAIVRCTLKNGKQYDVNVDVLSSSDSSVTESTSTEKKKKEECQIVLSSEESTFLMKKGDHCKPTVTVRKTGGYGSSPTIRWTSSDSSVAKVDSLGNIHASKDGYATITCEAGDQAIHFSVNVISGGESGNSCELTLLSGSDAKERKYILYKQNAHNYASYDRYVAWHGCAHCSLATVLGAYSSEYKDIKPNEIIGGLEKTYADSSLWSKYHEKNGIRSQMPLSLNGISTLLSKGNVTNEYVPSFKYDDARADIINHLKTGNPIIFEVRKKNSKTGKSSRRWTNSYHTMVFLGVYTDNKTVLVCDSIDRSWYKGGQRYKLIDIDDIMSYMFSSTKQPTCFYYSGSSSDGGYIKIYDNGSSEE